MKLWVPIVLGAGVALLYTTRKARAAQLEQLVGSHGMSVRVVRDIDNRGNARRTPEGYIMSGRFGVEHVPAIAAQGIRLILGAVDIDDEIKAALQRHGINWVGVPIGSRWRHGDVIRYWSSEYPADQIMVHCEHGVDRTGNIIAHLLVTEHGWPIDDALFAVVYPHLDQVAALTDILASYGYAPRQHPTGTYSLSPIGRVGGMKALGSAYERLIRGNVEELRQL